MSGDSLLHQQHISGVSTQNHSQAFVGSARDVYFADSKDPQETFKEAASACRNALFLTDPCVDRESLISTKGRRVAGTCEWITHNESYCAWLTGGTRLLWISGGPGKGKTMLSVFLTEELERTAPEYAQLVFYFCSHQDEKRNTAVAVLRGLVHQIITKRPRLVEHALPYFETPKRTQQTLSSPETLWIIFSSLVKDAELGTMFCVLDGLDECDEGALRVFVQKIVGLLSPRALSPTTEAFRLAIVSRNIPGLQGCARVKLDPDNNEKVASDIERVISARVSELSRIEGFNDELRAAVQTALLERAEGTFLWVGFAMHELLQKQTCSEVLEALDNLPRGLYAIYSRMLLQIPAERRRTSFMILRWVTMALRPLQLQELAAAVGVQSFSPLITTERLIRDEIALCGLLLKVQEREVSLVHQSARDYFLREEHDSNTILEGLRIDLEKAHLELARTCFDCVAQSGMQHVPLDLDSEEWLQESPLLRYAVLYWPEHTRRCSALAFQLFSFLKPFFQEHSDLRKYWWEVYTEVGSLHLSSSPPLLHVACHLGIVPWVEAILTKKNWMPRFFKRVNKKDEDGMTALHRAASRGHEAVVRLLVGSGADVEAKDTDGRTALQRAAFREDELMVQLLVDSGADIEVKDKDGGTALHWAALGGHEGVVQLLVNSGADVEVKDENKRTALNWAALGGHEAVVRLLVDSGADVEAKDENERTALNWAALGGHEAVVQLLVDSGADVKAKDENEKTALHWAALGGHEAIVRLLLVNSEADVKAKDENEKTALHCAALEGQEGVVQLLVNNGADVKAKDKDGGTVLHWAALGGHEGVVQLLVNSGADVEAKDENKRTALNWAALGGHEAVVRLLVDSGADVEAKDKNERTALYWAAWKGHEGVVRLLVNNGADVEAKDARNEKTALQTAASRGHKGVVQLLVDSGANVEAKDEFDRTALYWAALEGQEEVVQLLVGSGADVEAKSKDRATALQEAAYREDESMVRLLVNSGADVKAKAKDGEVALHWAALGGHEGVVRLLVNSGADVEAKDENKRTALNWAILRGHEAVVRLLVVDNEADLEVIDKNGRTALHWAALKGHEGVVRLLVDSGADVEAKDESERTALDWAALGGHEAVVRLLLVIPSQLQPTNK